MHVVKQYTSDMVLWQPLVNFAIWWELRTPMVEDDEILDAWWNDIMVGVPSGLDAI